MSAIEVRGVTYDVGARRILSDVDLDADTGEVTAIMGMSGSGKTSLLKCLSGLVKPSGGTIRVGGELITGRSERDLERVRLGIGLVFQYAALFDSLSVYDNVSFGLVRNRRLSDDDVRQRVSSLLADVGMPGTESMMPSELSGGMQKRVGLARALAMEPGVLLYDEPTSGLDPVIARTIDDLIVDTGRSRKVTSVVVSHDIQSIFRIADRIAMVHEGRIVAVGRPSEIRSSSDPLVRSFVEAG